MKIDVEGAELSVLKGAQGALRTSRPAIFLSTHSDALRKAAGVSQGYGYACDVLSHDKVNPSEFLARPAPEHADARIAPLRDPGPSSNA